MMIIIKPMKRTCRESEYIQISSWDLWHIMQKIKSFAAYLHIICIKYVPVSLRETLNCFYSSRENYTWKETLSIVVAQFWFLIWKTMVLMQVLKILVKEENKIMMKEIFIMDVPFLNFHIKIIVILCIVTCLLLCVYEY